MKYRLETAELEILESDDFNAIMDEYYRCVERKVRATLYKAGHVFLEYTSGTSRNGTFD